MIIIHTFHCFLSLIAWQQMIIHFPVLISVTVLTVWLSYIKIVISNLFVEFFARFNLLSLTLCAAILTCSSFALLQCYFCTQKSFEEAMNTIEKTKVYKKDNTNEHPWFSSLLSASLATWMLLHVNNGSFQFLGIDCVDIVFIRAAVLLSIVCTLLSLAICITKWSLLPSPVTCAIALQYIYNVSMYSIYGILDSLQSGCRRFRGLD